MNQPPFTRNAQVDKPGIVGARWWHAALADEQAKIARRTAIRGILLAGGALAGLGAILTMCAHVAGEDDVDLTRQTSLDAQRAYGWNFGARTDPLVFDGVSQKPFDPAALPNLTDDLRPSQTELVPYYLPTLFQSPYAVPKQMSALAPEEATGFKPLFQVMKPIHTPAMDAAYARGRSLASVFAALLDAGGLPSDARTALVVDLPGPEAVAFAAGAASVFDPVFLFDNWPHPKGVARAHETLAAAAYYQPLFAKTRRAPWGKKPPMFVLDRHRLAPYTDESTQFDNRYVAKLPSPAASLAALDVQRVLYVVPSTAAAARELDDLNDDFALYAASRIDVKALALDVFSSSPGVDAGSVPPKPPPASPAKVDSTSDDLLAESGWVYYGGTPASHHSFFLDYPWTKAPRPASARLTSNRGAAYSPTPRKTPYSSGSPAGATTKPRPTTFGTVAVVVAAGTGTVLGGRFSGSGSWNRSSGGWGG